MCQVSARHLSINRPLMHRQSIKSRHTNRVVLEGLMSSRKFYALHLFGHTRWSEQEMVNKTESPENRMHSLADRAYSRRLDKISAPDRDVAIFIRGIIPLSVPIMLNTSVFRLTSNVQRCKNFQTCSSPSALC